MRKTEEKRRSVTEKLADHLLAEGLIKASLRSLARAAAMSDRMLLHYFTDKEELMTHALLLITERLKDILNNAISEKLEYKALLLHLTQMIKSPQIQPYFRLWLELAALAAGGDKFYRAVAQKISDSFMSWINNSMKVKKNVDKKPLSSLAFATIEGFVLFDAIGADSVFFDARKGIEIAV